MDRIGPMPVVDSHEHLWGSEETLGRPYPEPILALMVQYVGSDLWAAGATTAEMQLLNDPAAATDAKWPVFDRLWSAAEHTAYARVTKLVLRRRYGIERLSRAALDRVAEQLAQRTRANELKTLADAGIRAVVTDALFPNPKERPLRYFSNPQLAAFLGGRWDAPANFYAVFNLPFFHEIRNAEYLEWVKGLAQRDITSLAEYEEALFELIRQAKERGAVGLKDQSAYRRVIEYSLPPRAEAELVFNRLLIDPRSQLAWPDARPLDDYLFHQILRTARELDLPVQIHTGHMAGIRNRVDKANAAHFAPVLELHSQVRFDLFHGNWPYLGDILFIGKNYPNARLNLCWLPIVDPLYAQEFLQRAVMTVPHNKLHGFGGDYWDAPEYSAAHLSIAREVMAGALAGLVEMGWIEEEEAVCLAADWLYNNPNEFYRLGLPPLTAP